VNPNGKRPCFFPVGITSNKSTRQVPGKAFIVKVLIDFGRYEF